MLVHHSGMFLRMRKYVPYIIRRAPGERIMCTTFLVGAHFALNPKMALKAVCVMDSQSNGPVKGTITFTQEVTFVTSLCSLLLFNVCVTTGIRPLMCSYDTFSTGARRKAGIAEWGSA